MFQSKSLNPYSCYALVKFGWCYLINILAYLHVRSGISILKFPEKLYLTMHTNNRTLQIIAL
jgi:hypothetical protein